MKVLVTAFGPFEGHPTNVSSTVLDLLEQDQSWKPASTEVAFKKLDVVYDSTEQIIKNYWVVEKPDLTIHLGVHPGENVAVECQCNETVYTRPDVAGKVPAADFWPLKKSTLPLEDVVCRVGQECKLSRDAGTYLCQFVLHCSLTHGNGKSVFLHVPPVDTCSADCTVKTVRKIITEIFSYLSR
eukprot:sb/3471456/